MSADGGAGDTGKETTPGADLARASLEQAKAAARARGAGAAGGQQRRARASRGRSGDPRASADPQLLGSAISRLIADRGWEATTRTATVMGRWEHLVGPELAEHCRPASLRDGELVLVAESTAWATQVRLLSRVVLARLATELGPDVVRRIQVHGPVAPSWRKGPRRVLGRGPRDTYG